MKRILILFVSGFGVDVIAQFLILAHWETHYRYGGISGVWRVAWSVFSCPLVVGRDSAVGRLPWILYVNACLWGGVVMGLGWCIPVLMRKGRGSGSSRNSVSS